MSLGLGLSGGRSAGSDSRIWKTRPWGVVSTKREVTPDGSWRGGRVVGSMELGEESWCVYAIVLVLVRRRHRLTLMVIIGNGQQSRGMKGLLKDVLIPSWMMSVIEQSGDYPPF